MHREHPVEIGGREVHEQGLMDEPGIVYKMGWVAKYGARCAGDVLDVRFARDIAEPQRSQVAAARLDLCRNGLRRVGAQVVESLGSRRRRAEARRRALFRIPPR